MNTKIIYWESNNGEKIRGKIAAKKGLFNVNCLITDIKDLS